MKVYYDKKLDQLVIVTYYPTNRIYIYSINKELTYDLKSPKSSGLVYVGEFYSGDLYEMD